MYADAYILYVTFDIRNEDIYNSDNTKNTTKMMYIVYFCVYGKMDEDYQSDYGGAYEDTADLDYGEDDPTQEEEGAEDDSDAEDSPTITTAHHHQIIVTGKDRRTPNIMTKFEYSRLVSGMATLYSNNFPVHPALMAVVKERNIIDPLDLAELHMEADRDIPFPLDILRPYQGVLEAWNARELFRPSDLSNPDLVATSAYVGGKVGMV